MKKFILLLAALLLPLGAFAQTQPAVGVRTLYLVRHGIYDPVPGADSKVANALNPLGREQAELAGGRLAALPVKFDTIVSSEFLRARETGDIIATKLGAKCQRDPLLNECTPPGAGLAATSVEPGAFAQLEQSWASYARATAGTTTHDLLVCHGNVIRWFVCKALGVDVNQWTRMEIANASLTIITVRSDGSARLEIFNEVAHLPIAKQTWSGKGPGWAAAPTK